MATSKPRSFQDMILTLHDYWSAQGCVILQPYDMEVGAGTFHWATALKSLGSEPWRAAYVQPCRRPADGRYGENPNRLQHYFQYQVLLKPSPKESQELYLDSLRAIGIEVEKHDIRFVEDDWESPTLGAKGLGWEVWCDGMEVSQFTYFQQVGGFACELVSTELTYGLERLAMYLQEKETIFDLQYNDAKTYGEVYKEMEKSYGRFNFEQADVEELKKQFDECERQCIALCDAARKGNKHDAMPAYDYCLKASHIFNLLDARGAVQQNARPSYILRVRTLAHTCCAVWLGQERKKTRQEAKQKTRQEAKQEGRQATAA